MDSATKKVGLIGVGLVGTALVKRFTDAGFTCIGYDIDPGALSRAEFLGLQSVDSPAEVGSEARRIVLSLPNSDFVEEAVEGPSGLASTLRAGDIVIDTTTSDPERSMELASRLGQQNIDFLDATILGSSKMVAIGTSLVMVGGQAEQIDKGRDLLETFSNSIHHVGPNGKGAEAKLIVNLVLGLNRLVLAEGLLLGKKAGVNLGTLLGVLKGGAAYSKAMDQKGNKMVHEDFEPEARLAQHLKDVGLILDMGMKHDTKLPISSLHADILRAGVEAGYGEQDNSAVIKALEHYVAR